MVSPQNRDTPGRAAPPSDATEKPSHIWGKQYYQEAPPVGAKRSNF